MSRYKNLTEAQIYLSSLGLNVNKITAGRFEKVLRQIALDDENSGVDLASIGRGVFKEEGSNGMIIEPNIPIFSWCEHHIMPWFGSVHIGYIAQGRLVGLSKFTRIVKYFSKGITIQERVAKNIAVFISKEISPDVIVMIEALHTCKARSSGVANPLSKTKTIEAFGIFRTDPGPRVEFFDCIRGGR